MKRRLFIAITISDSILKDINKTTGKTGLPGEIRFSRPENWHITLSFLGDQDDEGITRIISALEETAGNFECPDIVFEKFSLAPPGKKPRMIWLETDRETSARLAEIKNFLEDKLFQNNISFERENRRFSGHITLARFAEPPAGLSEIKQKAGWQFSAQGIDLFESVLKRSGPEYIRMAAADFS